MRREQRAPGVRAANAKVLGEGHEPSLAQPLVLGPVVTPADRADSGDSGERLPTFLQVAGAIQVRDTLLGHDVGHVVAVHHDGGEGQPGIDAHLHRVQRLDEPGRPARPERLHHLHHELAPA